ncbi:MAG: MFS transporter, partial [Anaerolineales bacterium]|nr:MFS transporter [Anaerolineales bacterium]
ERKGTLLVATVVGAGSFLMLFGLSHWYELSLLLVFAAGAALAAYDATMKALVLLQADDDWRGRVQSLYTLTFGFVSIGGFVAGTVATAVSVSFALVMNGGIILAFVGKNGRSLRQLGTPIPATPQAAD